MEWEKRERETQRVTSERGDLEKRGAHTQHFLLHLHIQPTLNFLAAFPGGALGGHPWPL